MADSYHSKSSGKPYYHWLERAQLGQLDCAVIRWPTLSDENLFKNLNAQHSYFEKYLTTLPKLRSYSYTENSHKSRIFELVEGHKYVPQQSFLRELSQTVFFYLKNETKLSLADATQIELNPPLPREINPLYIEKRFDLRLVKEDAKIMNWAQCLGASPLSANEMLLVFVISEMIDNLIILKDKFPEFKIYLQLPYDKLNPDFDYAVEIESLEVLEGLQKAYYLQPQEEESQPFLGKMLLSDQLEHSDADQKMTLFLNHSRYQYKNKKLSLVPSTMNKANGSANKHLALESIFNQFEKSDQGLIAKGHSSIRLLQDFFQQERNLFFKADTVSPSRYGLSYENGSGFESFSSSISFWTEFQFNGNTYRVHNFQHTQESIFRFISGGLSYFSDLDRKDMATFRKGSKRDHDLKILKHQGVAALITVEACYHILDQPMTTGEVDLTDEEAIKVIERNIFNLFKKSIFVDKYGEAFVSRTHLKDYISDRVYDFLIETIRNVIELIRYDSRYLSLGKTILKITNYASFSAQTILAFLEPIMNATRGEVFTKGNSKYLDPLVAIVQQPEFDEPVFEGTALETELKNQYIIKSRVSDFVVPFLYNKMTELSSLNWAIYIDGLPIEKLSEDDFRSELVLQTGKMDWFELSPKLFFKGIAIRIEDIKFSNASAGARAGNGIIFYKGRPYIIDPKSLPKYSLLEKFWERIKKEAQLSGNSREKEFVRVPRSSILELLALAESGTPIITDNPYWNEIYNFYKNIGSTENHIQLPSYLNEILKDYQVIGTQWIYDLYRLHLGGVLADDMGLGKTLQVLAFLNQHRLENYKTWSLVVVPTSLCFNWENEAKKFTPELDIEVFSASKKKQIQEEIQKQGTSKHKVLIVTYGLLIEHEEFFTEQLWDIAVFDEAQNLKNLSSRRTSSARTLKAKFKLALSGTPLENNYLDFFSLADLVLPGALGSYKSFNEVFGIGKSIESEDLIQLKQKMKPIVLRRTKSAVNLNLPTKSEESYHLDFTPEQMEIYKKLALSHNDQVSQLIKDNGAASSQIAMLTALLRLRQVCSDPNGVPNIKFNDIPPKLSYIVDCMSEHMENGRSVLVFTQFLATLESLSKLFIKNNIPYSTIHGAISSKNRSLVLDQFQNSPQPQVLLMTLKTGGVGLNLTKASVVYHIEPWWNPAVENQATDRVHRLGQKNDINVYRLIMKDSVEEKIEQLKLRKKSYFDSLFSNEEAATTAISSASHGEHSSNYLSAEDFKFLLGV